MSTPPSSAPRPEAASGLFKDLVVLDLTLARAGPTTVRQFADWGANVITIEAPPGEGEQDMFRRSGHDFQNLHRNKRSVALDLKSEAGHAAFMQLVARADIIVENMRPPVKHRLKVDYESCAAVNPRIVYGSISGFGQDGPYRDRAGVDQIAQGMGGHMSVTGEVGRGPMRSGAAINDMFAGILCANAIAMALWERERTGRGQWVQASLLQAQIFLLDFQAARWLIDKEVPGQAGNEHPTNAPSGLFQTSDGHINIAPVFSKWRAICEAIGAPDLIDDPRYQTQRDRRTNRVPLNARIAERILTNTSAYWVEVLNGVGCPCGPVYSMDQVFADPQVIHLQTTDKVFSPSRNEEIEVVGQAIRFSGHKSKVTRPAPERGEHTEEVLREFGIEMPPAKPAAAE